jgi:hypothetical protein
VSAMLGWTTVTTKRLAALRLHPGTWTRTRCLTAIPTHTAKAFVHPTTPHRERAKCRRRIMERIERASTDSSMQLQAFVGQCELIFLISLKFLIFTLFHCNLFHGVCKVVHSQLYSMERSWAAAGFPAARPELHLGPHARSEV